MKAVVATIKTQKNAVYEAIQEHFAETGRTLDSTKPIELSREEKRAIAEKLVKGIEDAHIEFGPSARQKYDTPQKIKTYVTSVIGNWLIKDTRLNGNNIYKAKNPGSRIGRTDEKLKNLRALYNKVTDEEHRAAVEEEIKTRQRELLAAKKRSKIDMSVIPEELKTKLKLNDSQN